MFRPVDGFLGEVGCERKGTRQVPRLNISNSCLLLLVGPQTGLNMCGCVRASTFYKAVI